MLVVGFVTLFLGLSSGVRPVELMAGERVAAIELYLDGRVEAVITQPPWKAQCDFGKGLIPHELVAVAKDHRGVVIGRARQLVNMPRPPAELSIVVEREDDGTSVARLAWQSVVASDPESTTVTFDGLLLDASNPKRVVLPPHDPGNVHFLHARVRFSDGVWAEGEVGFGGSFGEDVATRLTAVPVVTDWRRQTPRPEEVEGWLVRDGAPVRVAGVEYGDAEAVVVVERGAEAIFDRMIHRMSSSGQLRRFPDGRARLMQPWELLGRIGIEMQLRLVRPFPILEDRGGDRWVKFQPSRAFDRSHGGLLWVLENVPMPRSAVGPQYLADAVAVAGLIAAGRGQRRAVVLITANKADDHSEVDAAVARSYLERLRVPLVVWSPERKPDRASPWGPIFEISTRRRIQLAMTNLHTMLEKQRIVWVEGAFLPHEIVPAPGAETRLRLAGVERQ